MHRILFVDDEPKILTGLRRMLRSQRREWDMEFAEGGVEALNLLREAPFDVVVSDARMPQMEGSQLLEHVRHDFPDTVRMILSGQCSRTSVLRCVEVAHQFHSKPCDSETLKDSIRQICSFKDCVECQAAREAVSAVASLPSRPAAHAALSEELATDKPSFRRVAEIVRSDVALSLKLVQMVSTGFFGTPQTTIDVNRAVDLIGAETIRALASLPNVFRVASDDEFDANRLEEVNDHSESVAAAAKAVAESTTEDRQVVTQAHVAGMFHEIGALVSRRVESALPADAGLVSHVSGFKAGGYLAALWGLPKEVAKAIGCHRTPNHCNSDGFTALTAVHIAHAFIGTDRGCDGMRRIDLDMDYLERIGVADRVDHWGEICHTAELGEVLQ